MSAPAPAINPWLVAVAVSLAAFMEVLDTTITNVSLSHIAGTLAASQDESTWVLTSYLVANGIVLPISGWLSNVIGRKRYFMMCIAAFTAASFACGAATSLGMLIVFRLIQGLAGGGLQPVQQAIILDSFPPEKRAAAFGITSITIIVAPILGPTLGGWITDNFSWRWIFYLNIPVGLFALWLVNRTVQDPPHAMAKKSSSIDYIGLSLIALGLGALQIVLDKGQQDDWFDSSFIISMALISISCLVGAVWWILRQPDPIVELRLLANRSFGLPCLMIFFTGFVLYSSSALLPLLVQSQFGYDATLAGLVISPGGLFIIFLMPLSGKLVGKIAAKYLIMFGLALSSFGMWCTMHVTPQIGYSTFAWMRVAQVLGLPFLFIPTSTLAFMKIPKEQSNKASALYSLSRNLGGSAGIAIITSYVSRHQQTHQAYMVDNMGASNPNVRQTLTEYSRIFIEHGYSMASAADMATGRMYRELIHQSSLLAYKDAFMFLSVVMGSLILACVFLPYNRPGAKAAAAPAAH